MNWLNIADSIAQGAVGFPCRSDDAGDFSLTASVWTRLTLDTDGFFAANPALLPCRPMVEHVRSQFLAAGVLGDGGPRTDCPDCARKRAAVVAANLGKKMAWFVAQAWGRDDHRAALTRELGLYVINRFAEIGEGGAGYRISIIPIWGRRRAGNRAARWGAAVYRGTA